MYFNAEAAETRREPQSSLKLLQCDYVPNENYFIVPDGVDVDDKHPSSGPGQIVSGQAGSIGCAERACNGSQ